MTAGADATDPAVVVRGSGAAAALASRWTMVSAADRDRAAEAALTAMPASAPGLIRYSVYRGLDDLTLVHLSQWSDEPSRDHYVDELASRPRGAVDAQLPNIERNWRELVVPYRSYVSKNEMSARCLVVVRQPMKRPDTATARDWVDKVIHALDAGKGRMDGLVAATFLVSADGDVALNLAEWTSADDHRAALQPADFGTHGSIGDGEEWRAARAHPGVTADHEVSRYALVGTVEPGDAPG